MFGYRAAATGSVRKPETDVAEGAPCNAFPGGRLIECRWPMWEPTTTNRRFSNRVFEQVCFCRQARHFGNGYRKIVIGNILYHRRHQRSLTQSRLAAMGTNRWSPLSSVICRVHCCIVLYLSTAIALLCMDHSEAPPTTALILCQSLHAKALHS